MLDVTNDDEDIEHLNHPLPASSIHAMPCEGVVYVPLLRLKTTSVFDGGSVGTLPIVVSFIVSYSHFFAYTENVIGFVLLTVVYLLIPC
jgi:hypothetical protein